MAQPTEIKVRVKSEDTTLTEDFLSYDPITLSRDDIYLSKMVTDVLSKYHGELKQPDIVIKAKFTW